MNELRNSMDAQTARTLYIMIADRFDRIDALYGTETSPDRTKALEDLIHLVNEFGYDVEQFLHD